MSKYLRICLSFNYTNFGIYNLISLDKGTQLYVLSYYEK